MKNLDKIESDAQREIIERSESSIHYRATPVVSPEEALALVATIRELLAYAKNPNSQHTEECSWVTTYNHKSLDCDCYKAEIVQTITRNLGEDVA